MSKKQYKSIKIESELYDALVACEIDGTCRGTFTAKIKEALVAKENNISPDSIEALVKSFDDDTPATNLDAFIKSIAVAESVRKMESLSPWTKDAAGNLVTHVGFSDEDLFKCSQFEDFANEDIMAAVMSLYVKLAKVEADG